MYIHDEAPPFEHYHYHYNYITNNMEQNIDVAITNKKRPHDTTTESQSKTLKKSKKINNELNQSKSSKDEQYSDLDDKTRQEFEDLLNTTVDEPTTTTPTQGKEFEEDDDILNNPEEESSKKSSLDASDIEQAAYEARFAKLILRLKQTKENKSSTDKKSSKEVTIDNIEYKPSLAYLDKEEEDDDDDDNPTIENDNESFSVAQYILKQKRKVNKSNSELESDNRRGMDPFDWRLAK